MKKKGLISKFIEKIPFDCKINIIDGNFNSKKNIKMISFTISET